MGRSSIHCAFCYVDCRYLNTLKSAKHSSNGLTTIRASLQDIRDSDKKGRWWLTGAAWVGNIGHHDSAQASDSATSASANSDAQFDQRLLALARAQRMNTDVRRSIFCVMMGGEDFLDACVFGSCSVAEQIITSNCPTTRAPCLVLTFVRNGWCRYEKLMKLNLKKTQQREIVRVLMHCCGQSAV